MMLFLLKTMKHHLVQESLERKSRNFIVFTRKIRFDTKGIIFLARDVVRVIFGGKR